MSLPRWPWALLSLFTLTPHLDAQGTRADYERAQSLSRLGRQGVVRSRIEPHWIDGGRQFWYERVNASGARETILVDCETGKRRVWFERQDIMNRVSSSLLGTGSETPQDSIDILDTRIDSEGRAYVLGKIGSKAFVGRVEDDTITMLEHDTPHPFLWEPPERRSRRRTRSNPRVDLLVENRTDKEISLEWLDDGERRHYARIAPGTVHRQNTFPDHEWMVITPDREIGPFVAPRRASLLCIEADMRQPRRSRGSAPDRRERRQPRNPNTLQIVDGVVLLDSDVKEPTSLSEPPPEGHRYLRRFIWSDDHAYAIGRLRQSGDGREVTLVESSPRDRLQPRTQSYTYDKPGDTIDIDWPFLVDVRNEVIREIPRELFENPFSLRSFEWHPDTEAFTFLYNQRGHQCLRVLEVDAKTATPRVLIEETSETFIDYSSKTFLHFVEGGKEILWMSERDGWNHLYLYDRQSGDVLHQITSGEWVVRDVLHVDDEAREIWFRACGVYEDQDPYYVHFGRVSFDGGEPVFLTDSDGTHTAEFSPDRRYLFATHSRVDLPPVFQLRDGRTGRLIEEIDRAGIEGWRKHGIPFPERFVAKGRDSQTDIYGVIYRPTHLDESRKYPVVESIYAGPHGQHVPKSFSPMRSEQALAEIGFIVVRIDGMGTNWRSKAFHDVAWKNIKDAGFPDRIRWIRAAAERYPYMDLERVGVYGGSAGGQNAMRGLLDHADFYKVAVADCGCHDNRMDKIWWNEQWMGWPIDDSYARSSNSEDAHKLQGKLLLTVGELDRNVDPASTMQVVDALIRADKDFDLIVFPGAGHGAIGSSYGVRRRRDFFVRHLWGLEPRRE